jgi:ubiquinol-cytochrome c reductase iron-sulfur subunit
VTGPQGGDGREIEGEVLASSTADRSTAPQRRVGRRPAPSAGPRETRQTGSDLEAPPEANAPAGSRHLGEDAREDRFGELQVSALFVLGAAGTIFFCVAYFLVPSRENYGQYLNYALGGGLALSLLSVGGGMALWAKKLMPHDKAVQEREPFHSPEEEELLTEQVFLDGVDEMGLGRRPILRRTLMGVLALLPLPAILLLRDLGPLPHARLRKSGWKAGDRLVDLDTRLPVKLGDLDIGAIQTVMPEGFTTVDDFSMAPTILIRFGPNQIKSTKEQNWGADNHVAFSKICTHAGCPISLYEQQTHHLLCPCHQSTFDMAHAAKVLFGPAARPLPQLRIYVDGDGYFRAHGDYSQPVGPSFWERR